MFPIGETMSQKILEVSGKRFADKLVLAKRPKVEVENKNLAACKNVDQAQRRGSVDSMLNVKNVDGTRRMSADLNATSPQKKRSSSESTQTMKRDKSRNAVPAKTCNNKKEEDKGEEEEESVE